MTCHVSLAQQQDVNACRFDDPSRVYSHAVHLLAILELIKHIVTKIIFRCQAISPFSSLLLTLTIKSSSFSLLMKTFFLKHVRVCYNNWKPSRLAE